MLVGVDDPALVLLAERVLAFAFHEMVGGVDEEHVVGLLALFQHEDADGDAGGIEEIGGQTDHRVDVFIFEQLGADASRVTYRFSFANCCLASEYYLALAAQKAMKQPHERSHHQGLGRKPA